MSSKEDITLAPNYGSLEFWKSRYDEKSTISAEEFYCSYDALKHIIEKHADLSAEILILGVGASTIPSELYDDGYSCITAIDYLESIIRMQRVKNRRRKGIEFRPMDICSLEFPAETFDFVFDKATIDSLLCSSDGYEKAITCVAEANRVLKPNGTFIFVSHSGPMSRLPLLRQDKSLDVKWKSIFYVTTPRTMGVGLIDTPSNMAESLSSSQAETEKVSLSPLPTEFAEETSISTKLKGAYIHPQAILASISVRTDCLRSEDDIISELKHFKEYYDKIVLILLKSLKCIDDSGTDSTEDISSTIVESLSSLPPVPKVHPIESDLDARNTHILLSADSYPSEWVTMHELRDIIKLSKKNARHAKSVLSTPDQYTKEDISAAQKVFDSIQSYKQLKWILNIPKPIQESIVEEIMGVYSQTIHHMTQIGHSIQALESFKKAEISSLRQDYEERLKACQDEIDRGKAEILKARTTLEEDMKQMHAKETNMIGELKEEVSKLQLELQERHKTEESVARTHKQFKQRANIATQELTSALESEKQKILQLTTSWAKEKEKLQSKLDAEIKRRELVEKREREGKLTWEREKELFRLREEESQKEVEKKIQDQQTQLQGAKSESVHTESTLFEQERVRWQTEKSNLVHVINELKLRLSIMSDVNAIDEVDSGVVIGREQTAIQSSPIVISPEPPVYDKDTVSHPSSTPAITTSTMITSSSTMITSSSQPGTSTSGGTVYGSTITPASAVASLSVETFPPSSHGVNPSYPSMPQPSVAALTSELEAVKSENTSIRETLAVLQEELAKADTCDQYVHTAREMEHLKRVVVAMLCDEWIDEKATETESGYFSFSSQSSKGCALELVPVLAHLLHLSEEEMNRVQVAIEKRSEGVVGKVVGSGKSLWNRMFGK
ncbi:hypothetical protein ADUPG1_008352 [Aduncisulcus paluster]|uniref:Methyltransferase type 11 domain-containing protein n=1 Tax=Aduncisulcus paluster TaxID=2918883 RepID=A0ABQ5KRQ7_9EUKA|nr:hypothetical protein ADUPG1_008352 [Aduncisulcus paluster]